MTLRLELVDRPCPLCGSVDVSRIVAAENIDQTRLGTLSFSSRKLPEYMHYRLVECPVCGLLYASPAPPPGVLADAYDEAGYGSRDEAVHAAETYDALLEPLLARLPDLNGAVDVGAGEGAFLERLLERGFADVVGVEPSPAAIASASDDVRPFLLHGVFERVDLEPGRYSLATCFQTIEHVHDPLEVCRRARELLKPGGALLLVCHDRRALSARLLGRRSPIFDVEHLQLFCRRTLQTLLERAGFVGVETRSIASRYPLHYWVTLAPLPPALKHGLLRALAATGTGSLRVTLRAGNLAATGYRP